MNRSETLTPDSNADMHVDVAVIGGGPAGLMAAEVIARAGHAVHVFDAMPSVGRKFLLAGKGGMNLTHAEPLAPFIQRYAERAEVKLETFPCTRYGTVDAPVKLVTADAVTNEKRGSYYPAVLTLSQNTMDVDGKRVPLSPGMNITAEIKTGQRRVIEFLLSPVQRAGRESLRER